MMKRIWLLELQQYSLYIIVPIEFSMQRDGVRPEGNEYRALVESQMAQLLEEYHVRYIRVSGTPEERNTQAAKTIDNLFI
jgi:nicotinamide riboside kinase